MSRALTAAGALLLAVPIVVVIAGARAASANSTGLGYALLPGTVPATYEAAILQAGSLCPAAPPPIIAAQIDVESGWNPNAVSASGAEGLSQFLPGTWSTWSRPGQSPFDPIAAIAAQGRYDCALAAQMQTAQLQGELSAQLTITQLMLAAYNAGPVAVETARGIPNNGLTPAYVTNILAKATHYADPATTAETTFAAAIVAAGLSQLGVPYAWDGGTYTGPTLGQCVGGSAANDCHINGYDCSGLTMFALFQASGGRIRLTHFTQTQVDDDAARYGAQRIARGQQKPGDLIAFTDPGASDAHHIAIYVGAGDIVQAPESGEDVDIASLSGSYWLSQQWTVVRFW